MCISWLAVTHFDTCTVQYITVHWKESDHSSSQISIVCIIWPAAANYEICTVGYSTLARELITVTDN